MKKVIIYISLLFIFSCSSIQNNAILTDNEKNNVVNQILKTQEYIVLKAKENMRS